MKIVTLYPFQIITEAPWELSDEYLTKHKIDFVAHDEIPYVGEGCNDIYAPIKQRGMFVATERTEGVSTSDIVARIVKDYDIYVRRNLARGYSAKDLNVSFLKEKKFKFQNKMDELRDKVNEKKSDLFTKWEEKSREFIENFLFLFGKEHLSTVWNKSKGRVLHLISPNGSPEGSLTGGSERGDDDDDDDDLDEELCSPPLKRLHAGISNGSNRLRNKNGEADDDDDDDDYDAQGRMQADAASSLPPTIRIGSRRSAEISMPDSDERDC